MGDTEDTGAIPKKQSRSHKLFFKLEGEVSEEMGKPRSDQSPLGTRRIKKERWLLTRKTWRYMADAGRRLIPEGSHNRPEDVPKIEKYFQEVCQTEPKFLLWRKASYPGALGLRAHNRKARTRKKAGSYREKASSADEADDIKKSVANPCGGGLFLTPMSGGRFDLKKLSDDKLKTEDELLQQLKTLFEHKGESSRTLNHQELFDKLEQYLRDIQAEAKAKHRFDVTPDLPQRQLLETVKRYYSRSPNRESVISNLLTDRKLLEKLYFDLRKTRGFRGAGSAYLPEWRSGVQYLSSPDQEDEADSGFNPLLLHPPLTDIKEVVIRVTKSSQSPAVHPDLLKAIDEKLKRIEEEAKPTPSAQQWKDRRRSSVDHDDVSPSVGDTIKRYLKMARKKSIDTDKADRFKRINYDQNLRNIKGKGIPMPGDDDGLNKGCQTETTWTEILKTLPLDENWIPTADVPEVVTESEEKGSFSKTPSVAGGSSDSLAAQTGQPKGILSSGQSFLSNLFQGLQLTEKNPVLPAVMQKSKSTASVGRSLVSKKIWRGRSKSQSRVPTPQTCSWTPQGNCTWTNITGRTVTLGDTNILALSEIERKILQKVAVAKLQALNLGCNVRIPAETIGATVEPKPKRRAHLLKRKAITTSFFDTPRAKEKDGSSGGAVFGVSLSQCVENERVSRHSAFRASNRDSTFPDDSELGLRRKSHHGSRSSFTSLIEPRILDESAGSSESLGGSVGLLDSLSTGSMVDIAASTSDSEPVIPNIVAACLRHIENYGLHILGIFRVSSSKKRVRQLREDFDTGKEITLGESFCPHDVATLLKEYFRDLPEPLLCKDLYQPFVQTQKIRNRRLQYEAVQHLIQLLPVPNRDTLWALMNSLSLVAANADDHRDGLGEEIAGNRMDSNNLATLFAPNILHSASSSQDQMSAQASEERIDVINVIRTMIDHNRALFQISAELLDEVYIHMMDSHPEALDVLLRKRDTSAEEVNEDPDSGVLEEVLTGSESSSVPATPRLQPDALLEERRAISREQFLHANAGFDIYNLDPRNRSRDRGRERQANSKKVRDSDSSRLSSVSLETEHFESRQSMTEQRYSLKSQEDARYVHEEDTKHSSVVLDNTSASGVIKASLTIPTSSFALNLDDSDIPFIEDSQATITEGSRHQISIGLMRSKQSSNSSSYNRTWRQRSISGSDSSQTSTPVTLQPITGSLSLFQGRDPLGYDSAVGSSATFSSPPQYTASASVCSSIDRDYYSSPPRNTTSSVGSGSDRDILSSPPSWASSPPLSPSSITTMDYTPEDMSSTSTIGRISIGARSSISEETTSTTTTVQKTQGKTKESKVTFTKDDKKSITKDLYQRVHSLVSSTTSTEPIIKSASSSQLGMSKKLEPETESNDWSRKVTTSISNIGGAVMRSKTADIERMLRIKPDTKKMKSKTDVKPEEKEKAMKSVTENEEKKKYAKRRYTDARHQTKTLVETTEQPSSQPKTQSVWKRRELISSPLKDDDS